MMLRIFIHVLFIIFLFQQVNAQKTSENGLDIKSYSKEFNLSVFTGWSKGGPANDMLSNMNMSSHSASWWGGRSRNYNTNRIFDIEGTYYLAKNMGISANFGLINNIEIYGYTHLESKIRTISINYVYRSKNKRHGIFIGPTYFIHSLKHGRNFTSDPSSENYTKPGAYIGYSLQMIQKKHWFIALKTNYRWAPKSEIGPFVDESSWGNTYEFSPTKVNLSCLNVGLSVGIRIHKD